MRNLIFISLLFVSALSFSQGLSPGIVASSGGGSDVTPSAFSSAELGTYNDSIVLVLMDEVMNEDSIAPTTAFNFTGGVDVIGINAISINDDSLFIALDSALTIYNDSTFLVDYTPGWPKLQDAAENTVVAWVDSSVTNNLTTPAPDNMISNGTFDSDTDWTHDGTSISGGVANIGTFLNSGLAQVNADMVSSIADATDYTIEFDLAGFASAPTIKITDGDNGDVYVAADTYANGSHSIDFTTDLNYTFYGITFVFQSEISGTMDNVVFYER